MDATAPPGRRRWVDAAVLMLCQSSQTLVIGGIALFLPLIREELHLSFARVGTLDAVSTLVYAFMQIPAGALADRLGPRRLFIVGLAGVNLLALSFSFEHSYGLMVANQALSGFFRSLVFAPGLLLMASLFPADRRATAMGIFVAGGVTSNIFLNLLGPLFVGSVGWRGLFALFSCLGGLALLVFCRRPIADIRHGSDGIAWRSGAMALLRQRVMWLTAAIQYIRLAVVFGLNVWLPTLIVVDMGYSLRVAGAVVALSAAVTAPANFIGGYVSDRIQRPLLVIGGSLSVLAVTTFLILRVHGIVPLLVVIAINAIFVQFYFGPLFAVPIVALGARYAGLTSGFGNFFANLGGFTFVLLLGVIRDATGSLAAGFDALSAMCVLGVLCTIALSRSRVEPQRADSPLAV